MWMAAQRRECPNAANIHLIVQMVTFMLRTFYHTGGGGGGVCEAHVRMRAHTYTKATWFQTKMFREYSS